MMRERFILIGNYTDCDPQEFNSYQGLWQVLYNDDENGLQLVSADDVTGGKLLSLRGQNVQMNFDNFTLEFAGQFVNLDSGIISKARGIGSDPSFSQFWDENMIFIIQQGRNMLYSEVQSSDNRYQKDYNAMRNAKSQNENGIADIGKPYWLCSSYGEDDTWSLASGGNYYAGLMIMDKRTSLGFI